MEMLTQAFGSSTFSLLLPFSRSPILWNGMLRPTAFSLEKQVTFWPKNQVVH